MEIFDEEIIDVKVVDQIIICIGNVGGLLFIFLYVEGFLSILLYIKDIDLSGFNVYQKEVVFKLFIEEVDLFVRDDSDVGCIRDFELNLDFED